MYGKGLGVINTATGVSILPVSGNHRVLFYVAAGLMVSGMLVFLVSTVLSFRNRRSDSK